MTGECIATSDDTALIEEIETQTQLTLLQIGNMLNKHGIYQDDVQKQMLASHIKAMVRRSKTGEPLPDIDLSLFDEISEFSLARAKEVVALFDNLAFEEAHLLSVHFEVAKENELSTVNEGV
ncbi:MAG: transcriptional regulator [Plesiomonas sp.]|uniref:transcriptional regulator n=1 Tax=Plesiomonas sp. TaxID=2486279 RepID=UPI003F33721D